MRILVLNCGSSSLKWRLYDSATPSDGDPAMARSGRAPAGRPSGGEHGIGPGPNGGRGANGSGLGTSDGGRGAHGGGLVSLEGGLVERVTDHGRALDDLLSGMDTTTLDAVGHRMVHGGLRFTAPTVIDDEVVAQVTELIPLAPLHNPPNLAGVREARELLPDVPQVAVFDTAFHRTIPPVNSTYAIDAEVAARHGIIRYGFHGTSHSYVSRRTAQFLGREPHDLNVITLHLGNGASACAVKGGRSFATSMGLTPLEGLVMGSRCGDIDPAITFHLNRFGGMPVEEIDTLLNKRSGLRGLCGDNDMREVIRRRDEGDSAAALAFDVYCARIKSYVGAYLALLGRVDAITFTAGVGENAPGVRATGLAGLEGFGIEVDRVRNDSRVPAERLISPDSSPVAVCVIPTDEELEIATQTAALLSG